MNDSVLIVLGGDVNISALKEMHGRIGNIKTIAADKGLEAFDRAGIRPDLIMGDYDSVDRRVLDKYKNDETVFFNPVKDFTDGEAAIDRAIDIVTGSGRVYILGATGNRLDHTLANISLLKKCCDAGIAAEILNDNTRIRLYKGPAEISFLKEEEAYDFISLCPLGDRAEGVTIEGFKYDTKDALLVQGSSLGVSNELICDKGLITFAKGYLIVFETSDM